MQTALRKSVHSFIKWNLVPASEERLPDLTRIGCPQQQLCTRALRRGTCWVSREERLWPQPTQDGTSNSPCTWGDVIKISWSKAEDWGSFGLPVMKLQRNEEMSFAVGILLHGTICWCFGTNAPSCLLFILYLILLSSILRSWVRFHIKELEPECLGI